MRYMRYMRYEFRFLTRFHYYYCSHQRHLDEITQLLLLCNRRL
jgi:hypothetical protein